MAIKKAACLSIFLVFISTLIGCATTISGSSEVSQEFITSTTEQRKTLPLNPRHGDVIWQNLKIGMTAEEVLKELPNSKFNDQWSSIGLVGIMGEAGIVATNKIKINTEINGPFKSKSNLYITFDKAGRLDGIIIATFQSELPEDVMQYYGTFGFNLAEYKEAAKVIIGEYAIPELGKRVGPPKFGKEATDSFGSVGVARSVSPNTAIGVGIPTGSISPSTIIQTYEKPGYRSFLSFRTVYLGLYGIYKQPIVFMTIQARQASEKIEDF